MKRWALLVVALYMLIMLVLAWPLGFVAFIGGRYGYPQSGEVLESLWKIYSHWLPWVWVGVMGLAQLVFLIVPVRLASRRPVSRRLLVWPALATVFLLAVMVAAAVFAVYETLNPNEVSMKGASQPSLCPSTTTFLFIGISWFMWGMAMLLWYTRKQEEPIGYMRRLMRFLLAGSIFEFVIAVPAHVIARWRDYCCAGVLTFWGLAAGISVALFAFGPAALIYFAKRWRSLRPDVKVPPPNEPNE